MAINAKVSNEKAVVESIKVWYTKKTYGPSYRDIAKATGISLGTVFNVCHELRDAGVITFQDGVARTIKLKSKKSK